MGGLAPSPQQGIPTTGMGKRRRRREMPGEVWQGPGLPSQRAASNPYTSPGGHVPKTAPEVT